MPLPTDPSLPLLEALPGYREYEPADMLARAQQFHAEIARRRSVRSFSRRAVPREVIEHALRAAGTAPSGANQQPWFFCVITDTHRKQRIRAAAEQEEREFYAGRAPQPWLDALAPLGTDADKPFLEDAPVLIAVFAQRYGVKPGLKNSGPASSQANAQAHVQRVPHYYVPESVGIATGFLIAALHHAGLCTLTHTPSPMGFLNAICERPASEKPSVLLVVGYPAPGCQVPVHGGIKKPLQDIAAWL